MRTTFTLPIFLALLMALLAASCTTSHNAHINDSKNINEIKKYIAKHPKDKNIVFLKQKLQALINAQNSDKNVKQTPPPFIVKTISQQEAEEFLKLMQLQKESLSTKAVNTLNQLFNSDISNKEAILLIKNNSNCNMIMRIQGEKYYNLAIPSNGENSIVLPQGTYKLSANLCDVYYTSQKTISKNMEVAIKFNTAAKVLKRN